VVQPAQRRTATGIWFDAAIHHPNTRGLGFAAANKIKLFNQNQRGDFNAD
jgi:hypothetical protein